MNEKVRKSNQLNFRLPQEDILLLEKQRATLKMTQVKFISHVINNGVNEIIEVSSPKLREDIVTIEKIFSQIGNNLNQIAAALNSGKQPNQDVLDVLSKLDKNMGVLTNRLESLKKEKITIKGDI